ncbi:MAG TPA: DegT/DnrJ/EryC1/StrS family aminotransferase [Dehalococcoidales bacterium]|nr:DegT/DnrJ/EryC1/StrS family aminotransferase [Dehalococcoidales bacterium]
MIQMAGVQFDEETTKAIVDVVKSGQIAQGPRVEEFEKAFAAYIGTKYAVTVNSGTAALHVALIAAGIGPGDEVITPSFSFIATANCCLFVGAKPVFADIDDKTFNISPAAIEKKITPKTRAVIIVDLYGQACEMDEITALCKKHNLVLIEDACQAHGAEYKGRKVGAFSIGCFSFYPTKNMTTGEGGMITTDDEEITRKSKLARQHGQSQRYVHDVLGYNFRMTDIAAALGLCQLKTLDAANARRIKNASVLTDTIKNIKGLVPPFTGPNRNHVFHQYTLKVTPEYKYSREDFQKKLFEKGVNTIIYYPTPIHQQRVYKDLGYNVTLPVTEALTKQVISLPVHPGVTDNDLQTICQAIKEISK